MYHSIFGGDQRRILFQWPSFYPEKKESKLEYLPCSEEIYTTYLLDDLVFICNNSDKIKSTTKYFNQEEITHLVKFFRDMYNFTFIPPQPKLTEESLESTPERKSFELGRKLLEHYNFNTDKMIEHLEHYVFLWDRRLEKEEYLDNINELLENWWKIDLETKN
jgi:hypothetical protein